MNLTALLLTLVLVKKSISTADKWVDPFNVDFVSENRVRPTVEPTANNWSDAAPSGDAMLYYKRTINLLLSSVVPDEISGSYKGRLVIDIPIEDFRVLKEFSDGAANEPLMLQKVNEILTNTLEMTFVDQMELAIMSWSEVFYNVFVTKTTAVSIVVVCLIYVVYRLFNAKLGWKEIVRYLLIEVEINHQADSLKFSELPSDCFPGKMTGWEIVMGYFKSTTDCRKYYNLKMYDVFWDVSPLDVMAHQTRVLVQIMGNVGTAISQMTVGLMDTLPYPFNLVILPFLMLFTLFLLSIVFIFCTNTDVSVKIMHLFQFRLKKTRVSQEHRPQIEDVLLLNRKEIKNKRPRKQQSIKESNKSNSEVAKSTAKEQIVRPICSKENSEVKDNSG